MVAGHEVLNHYQPIINLVDVMNLVSTENIVWSYVRPGCVVYQWDVKSRSIVNKLDCSKLVPCSESLKSIAIEEHLSPTNCQVSFKYIQVCKFINLSFAFFRFLVW